MNNKLLFLATSACVLTALVPVSRVLGAWELSQRLPETESVAVAGTAVPVRQILAKLKGKTQVPIFIPSRLIASRKLYYYSQAQPNSYAISIDYMANCRGAGACNFGEVRAQKGGEFSAKVEGVTKTLKNVKLADGMKGIFHNGCGAYCTASIEWKNQGFMYTVSIKNGRESDVILTANSAILAGKR